MTNEQVHDARRLLAKNTLKSAVYKLKAGVTLQREDRVVLLAYLNKMSALLKDVVSEKKLGACTADEILDELLATFKDQRPGHKLTFPIDDESRLEIVLLEVTKDMADLYAFRVEVGDWGVAWTVDTLRGAAFVVQRFVQDKEQLRGRATTVAGSVL